MKHSELVNGMTPAAYYAHAAKLMEWAYLLGVAHGFNARELQEADREIEESLSIPENGTQRERVLLAVQRGLSSSEEISAAINLPLANISAILCWLRERGKIRKINEAQSIGCSRVTHYYEAV